MKVIFFANTDWYLFNFRLGLARHLKGLGHEVVMLSPPGEYCHRFESEGFRWLPLPMDRQSLNVIHELKLLNRILGILKREQPDLIHNFTIKCVVYGSLATRWLGHSKRINAVTGLGYVFISGSRKARLLRPLVTSLLKMALGGSGSRLIVQNPEDLHFFNELGFLSSDHIHLIRSSGVNVDRFSPQSYVRDKPFRVLLASRLLWEKGIQEYVDAAASLKSKVREIEFLLAGASDPGNPSAVPSADVARWKETGPVTVLGHVDDMDRLMHTVDLVVLPSYYREGVPRGLIEAAAMGLPIVTTDSPGCREIVEDGVNGFLVPVRNSAALRDRIEYLFNNPEVCRRFGTAGHKKVLDEFDERIVFRKSYAVYQELGFC